MSIARPTFVGIELNIMISIKVDASGVLKAATYLQKVGDRIPSAVSRAMNHTGAKARTQAARAISDEIGLGVRNVQRYLKTHKATTKDLSYAIVAKGTAVPMRMFKPKQDEAGVSVQIGRQGRYTLPHTFIVTNKFGFTRFGETVFERTSKAHLPIVEVRGPSVVDTLTSDAVIKSVEHMFANEFEPRLKHEVEHILNAGGQEGSEGSDS